MKIARYAIFLSAIGVVVTIGYLVYQMLLGPDRLQVSGRNFSQLMQSGELLAIAIILVSVIISGVVMRPFLRILFPGEIKNGITAQARVLKVWDTGVTVNENPQVGLLLEVSPETGEPFQAETKTIVSRLNVAQVEPGIKAEVKYDPQKPQRLQLQTLHIKSPTTTKAAARMEELNELREKGLITEEEYRRKREEILKTL
jgi:hypothetical protein